MDQNWRDIFFRTPRYFSHVKTIKNHVPIRSVLPTFPSQAMLFVVFPDFTSVSVPRHDRFQNHDPGQWSDGPDVVPTHSRGFEPNKQIEGLAFLGILNITFKYLGDVKHWDIYQPLKYITKIVTSTSDSRIQDAPDSIFRNHGWKSETKN